MKAFTSIEQGRKLAEILPLESADMHIISYQDDKGGYFETALCYSKWDAIHVEGYYPCYSLAALLSVLPSATLDSSDDHYFRIQCKNKSTEWYDNAIDACYEMILKLKERDLL